MTAKHFCGHWGKTHQRIFIYKNKIIKRFKIYLSNTNNSISCGWWEKSVFVPDEKEVSLGLVEVVGEIVRFWVHDVARQSKRLREPLQSDILTLRNVTLLEGNFNLQDISVGGQYIPWSVDL